MLRTKPKGERDLVTGRPTTEIYHSERRRIEIINLEREGERERERMKY